MCNPVVDIIYLCLCMVVKVVLMRKGEIHLVYGFDNIFFLPFQAAFFLNLEDLEMNYGTVM